MDTKDMQGHEGCGDCHHGMAGAMCGKGHWGHIVIKILVALFIFWAGVQFGELRGMIRAEYGGGYGYGMMGSYDGWGQGGYGFPGMMGGWARTTITQ